MRTRMTVVGATLLLVASVTVSVIVVRSSPAPGADRDAAQAPKPVQGLPLSFIENRGQVDPRVGYYLDGADASVYFTDQGLRLGLRDGAGTAQQWNLALDFVGAAPAAPRGLGRTPTVVSYFQGSRDDWRTGLPTYSRVIYGDLWPGIDLAYTGTGSRLKYSFLVEPGADPSRIALRWRGASDVAVDGQGRLRVSTPVRSLTDQAPFSFQTEGGQRSEVGTAYTLHGNEFGFQVGRYDPDLPLVIDPALVFAGFVGGSGADHGFGVALDEAGSTYLAGSTSSGAGFPTTVGPDTSYNGGAFDAYVAKVDPSGTSLVYAGFIGGSGEDVAMDVDVDGAGNAYVAGYTDDGTGFPTLVGPDTSYNGGFDAFVTKVAPSGTSLVYSGFIGGSNSDAGEGVAVGSDGSAYVVGDSRGFPTSTGPDTTPNGFSDAFVAKVNPAGTGLDYAGFIGGSADDGDFGSGIAVDDVGSAYVVGSSSGAGFTAVVGPDTSYNGGFYDGFVAKVNVAGTGFDYAGFIGGSGSDDAWEVAVDAAGNAYVAGTAGPGAGFPAVVGPDTSFNFGVSDGFIVRVNAAGTGFDYAGFVGGPGEDQARGVAVDPAGAAYVTGYTNSPSGFPAVAGPDTTHNGGFDAYVAKVSDPATGFEYSGFIGGSGDDFGAGVAVDQGGSATVVGGTDPGVGFPALVGPDLSHNGASDAFVARIETTAKCQGKLVTRLGSNEKDVIAGTQDKDVVLALGKNDTIRTKGAGDRVCAGTGNDVVKGGGGTDRLLGEKGRDNLNGGGGRRDVCKGGPGKDRGGKGCEKGRL